MDAQLCRGDPVVLYQDLKAKGAAAVKSMTDELISRPGEPTWGACV